MLRMADKGAFRPLWSEKVIDEAQRALERVHSTVDPNRFRSRFRSMNEAYDDALVTGWEPLAACIRLPDPNDAHVVAAALVGRAEVIVTENTKDFPDSVLGPLGLKAVHLDEFLLDQFELSPKSASRIIVEQANAMKRPPVDTNRLLERLSRSGAPQFSRRVREELATHKSKPLGGTSNDH